VRSCCDGILNETAQSILIQTAWSVAQLRDASKLMQIINDARE
jgi:hypothetical protein